MPDTPASRTAPVRHGAKAPPPLECLGISTCPEADGTAERAPPILHDKCGVYPERQCMLSRGAPGHV